MPLGLENLLADVEVATSGHHTLRDGLVAPDSPVSRCTRRRRAEREGGISCPQNADDPSVGHQAMTTMMWTGPTTSTRCHWSVHRSLANHNIPGCVTNTGNAGYLRHTLVLSSPIISR